MPDVGVLSRCINLSACVDCDCVNAYYEDCHNDKNMDLNKTLAVTLCQTFDESDEFEFLNREIVATTDT
jgi:hypothetical protein